MLTFLTAGESHGKGLTTIMEGLPAGLPLTEEYIARDLARRQKGYGRGGRMKIEQDHADIMSGVRYGLTLGTPLALWIRNRDWENWTSRMAIEPRDEPYDKVTRLRPGHTDLTGAIKYGFDDVRPVLERASARETAARVAVGAVCRRLLEEFSVAIHSHTVSIGGVRAERVESPDWEAVEASPVRVADPAAEAPMIAAIDAAKPHGDTVGGMVEVRASGVPMGLGSHVQWDRKLDGRIAQAIVSINAFKAVSFGDGPDLGDVRGSQAHDVILPRERWGERPWQHATNHAGGIVGGISNGEEIIVRAVIKPIPTLAHPLPSADLHTGEEVIAHHERSDVCVVPAAGVVAEAMVAIVLAQDVLLKFGGDSLAETLTNFRAFVATTGPRGLV